MNSIHRREASLLAVLLVGFLFALTGCGGFDPFADMQIPEAIAGEQIEINQTIGFYFKTGPDTYVKVTTNGDYVVVPTLANIEVDPFSKASWTLADGLSLEQSELHLVSQTVEWQEGDGTVRVNGLGIVVKASVRVKDDAKAGDKAVTVQLPALPLLAQLYGNSTPTFPKLPKGASFSSPDKVQVQVIRVHDSAVAKWSTILWKWAIVIVVAILIIVIIIIGLIFSD